REQQTVDADERALLDRYVRAWEGVDLDSFVALLRDDALLTMPPYREWYRGRAAIRTFFTWVWGSTGADAYLLVPIAANAQSGFAQYDPSPDGREWRAHAIHLLTCQDRAIAELTVFRDTRLFAAFGQSPVLPSIRAPSDAGRPRRRARGNRRAMAGGHRSHAPCRRLHCRRRSRVGFRVARRHPD